MALQLPIGIDIFGAVIEKQLDFVDKSLFIQEILDDMGAQVVLLTRPRRFGKTLNLSMLHHFFAAKAFMYNTKGMFDNLKIAAAGERYMRHQGQYPAQTRQPVRGGIHAHAQPRAAGGGHHQQVRLAGGGAGSGGVPS